MDIMNPYNFEHHRRKPRLSPRNMKDRYNPMYQSRGDSEIRDDVQNLSSAAAYQHNHHVENLVKHEVVSNYGDDDDEKMDDEVEDLSKN